MDRTNSRRTLTVGFTVAMLAVGVTALALGFRDRSPSRPPKTWVVPDGETRSFFTTQVVETDSFECADGPGVAYVPARGMGVSGSGGISVETGWDGVVTVTCDPGPPGVSEAARAFPRDGAHVASNVDRTEDVMTLTSRDSSEGDSSEGDSSDGGMPWPGEGPS